MFAEMSVEYVDHLGSDVNVVNAARVSFAKKVDKIDELKDKKLINYLAKNNHWSPLAHTCVSLRIKAPIFMARQFVKHQVGFAWNEESRRYIDDTPEFYIPSVWRGRPAKAKQGSSDTTIETGEFKSQSGEAEVSGVVKSFVKESLSLYEDLLAAGVAPEQARMVLPQNTMTNWIWTGSLVAFSRVCKLRLDGHAQVEAQELAQKIHDVVAPLYPLSWEALMLHTKA